MGTTMVDTATGEVLDPNENIDDLLLGNEQPQDEEITEADYEDGDPNDTAWKDEDVEEPDQGVDGGRFSPRRRLPV